MRMSMRRPSFRLPFTTATLPSPQGPSLTDVMNAISQVQQNQVAIMNALAAIGMNQCLAFEFDFATGLALSVSDPNPFTNVQINAVGSWAQGQWVYTY